MNTKLASIIATIDVSKIKHRKPDTKAWPSTIYYLKIKQRSTGLVLYKLGHTSRKLSERLRAMAPIRLGLSIQVLATCSFPETPIALGCEQYLHSVHRDRRYRGYLLPSGNSELYPEDILGLDVASTK